MWKLLKFLLKITTPDFTKRWVLMHYRQQNSNCEAPEARERWCIWRLTRSPVWLVWLVQEDKGVSSRKCNQRYNGDPDLKVISRYFIFHLVDINLRLELKSIGIIYFSLSGPFWSSSILCYFLTHRAMEPFCSAHANWARITKTLSA